MKWEQVADADVFLELSHKICGDDQNRYSLLYGIVLASNAQSGLLMLRFGDSAIAYQTSSKQPLVISDLNLDQAIKLAKYIDEETNEPISQIVGTKESINLVIDNLRQKHPGYPELIMSQLIYKNDSVKMPQINNKLIQAHEIHQNIVEEWTSQFLIDTQVDISPDPKYVKNLVEKRIELGQVFLLMKDGSPVSMCCKARPTANTISVNGVFTPIERRGEGLASEAVALLTQDLLKEYKSCSLYTDSSNPTSNKIYTNLGYELVCESLHFRLSE